MDGMGILNEEDTYNKMDGERGQVEKLAVCSRKGGGGSFEREVEEEAVGFKKYIL